jgi:HEAT repeat protein
MALLYFCLGLAFVATQTAAFALFLARYSADDLPFAYLLTAALAALAAFGYLRLVERLPLPRLLTLNLLGLLAGTLVVWMGLASAATPWVIFALPLWFQLLVNLGSLAYWALASALFDVRQGKRLFGLISAGNWLASCLAPLLTVPLVARFGTTSLLPLASLALVGALVVLRVILRRYFALSSAPTIAPRPLTVPPESSPLRSSFALLIFAFVFVWWLSFYFVDIIFLDQTATYFGGAEQIAGFLSRFYALAGLLALATTTLFTGPLVSRYGLRAGLLLVPTLVTVLVAAVAIAGLLDASLATLFMLTTGAKLVIMSLGFALDQPSHSVLYKPFSVQHIGRVAAVAEGIVQPLAVGAAGLVLLILKARLGFGTVALAACFCLVGAAWIAVVLLLIRSYPVALTQAFARRRLGDSATMLVDSQAVVMLQRELHSPRPGAVLYAMDALGRSEHPALADSLPALLAHAAPEVRREAARALEQLRPAAAVPTLRDRLAGEREPEVRAAMLQALVAVEPDGFELVSDALAADSPHEQHGAMVGLIRYGGIDGVLAAGGQFTRMASSPAAGDRVLAAQVLGSVGLQQFYHPLRELLRDADPGVRRAALLAAGQVCQPQIWPAVIAAGSNPSTERAAVVALAAGGEQALGAIEAALARPEAFARSRVGLVRACARIEGERAVRLLAGQLEDQSAEVRWQVLNALVARAYRAAAPAILRRQIGAEVAQAAWICAARTTCGDDTDDTVEAMLARALDDELQRGRERALCLLALLYTPEPIVRARQALMAGPAAHQAPAIEAVLALLPPALGDQLLPLLEALPADVRRERLLRVAPQPVPDRAASLSAIIAGPRAAWFRHWTRACAVAVALAREPGPCAGAIAEAAHDPEPLIRETALRGQDRTGARPMLTIEKVIVLKTVGIFSRTPEATLAQVAELLEELEVATGQQIFAKGDAGDSLYIIIEGQVRVHDGDRLLNLLGEREVFGEMALLDPEPRLASVTALAPTRLFRLAQAPFYELLSEQPEVAIGVIRVLTAYLRLRVRETAQLEARLSELALGSGEPST